MINIPGKDLWRTAYAANPSKAETEQNPNGPEAFSSDAGQTPGATVLLADPLTKFAALFGLHPTTLQSATVPAGATNTPALASKSGTRETNGLPLGGSRHPEGAQSASGKTSLLACTESNLDAAPTTKVQVGEHSLEQVADRLGLDPEALARANPQIDAPAALTEGQEINLPPEAKLLAHRDIEWPACYFPEGNLSEKQERQAIAAYYSSTREAQLEAASERGLRDYARQLSPAQIDREWPTLGEKLVRLASTPGHGLNVRQMDRIYVRHWAARHDAAIERHAAVNKALREKDPQAFSRGLDEYHHGRNLDALGTEYRESQTEEMGSAFMLRHYMKAVESLKAAEDAGKELTLPQLERLVLGRGITWDRNVGTIEQLLAFRGSLAGPEGPRGKPREGSAPTEPVRPNEGATAKPSPPEPVGPDRKLSTGKVANDNQPAIANDNQHALPRKMAVGDSYGGSDAQHLRQPITATASHGRGKGGDDPGNATPSDKAVRATMHEPRAVEEPKILRTPPSEPATSQWGNWRVSDLMTGSRYKPTQRDIYRQTVEDMATAMKGKNFDWTRTDLDPIIVDARGKILQGHHRIIAARLANEPIPPSAIKVVREDTIRDTRPWDSVALRPGKKPE